MHRRSEDQIHRVEDHHRRSVAVLNTLQASSTSLQDMVRKEVAVVREETRREIEALWRRNKQLEEAMVKGGLEIPSASSASTAIGGPRSASNTGMDQSDRQELLAGRSAKMEDASEEGVKRRKSWGNSHVGDQASGKD